MTEQFFWISKDGDAIYMGYGIEKIKELKIELIEKEITDSKLEPLIIVQYVDEEFVNSIILLKDLKNNIYIFEELDYPEINSVIRNWWEADFTKFKELISKKIKKIKN